MFLHSFSNLHLFHRLENEISLSLRVDVESSLLLFFGQKIMVFIEDFCTTNFLGPFWFLERRRRVCMRSFCFLRATHVFHSCLPASWFGFVSTTNFSPPASFCARTHCERFNSHLALMNQKLFSAFFKPLKLQCVCAQNGDCFLWFHLRFLCNYRFQLRTFPFFYFSCYHCKPSTHGENAFHCIEYQKHAFNFSSEPHLAVHTQSAQKI